MRRTIALKNGRSLIAGYTLARPRTTNWVVFLPESAAEFQGGSPQELKWLLGPRLSAQFNLLVINKPGLSPRGVDRSAFERSFRRKLRVDDALTALATVIPKSDKIYLVGYSEGAYLAPQIAARDARVQSIAMIGGGTRGWLKEEVSNASERGKAALLRQIREIERHPRSTKIWNGFSYATWYSYRQDSTLKALKGLNLPMLAILGGRDRIIDFKSTMADLNDLSRKKPVKTMILPTCGHSFAGHWPSVRRALNDFLLSKHD